MQLYCVFSSTNKQPIMAKFDKFVSYLPIFEDSKVALLASNYLLNKQESEVSIEKLDLSLFNTWKDQHRKNGIMLFLYPMSQDEIESRKLQSK